MPQTIEDLGVKVKAKYPGQYDDLSSADVGRKVKAKFPGAYDDFVDNAPVSATPSVPPKTGIGDASIETPGITNLRQSTIGANPQELFDRMKGAARSVGRIGMGAIQWGQYLTGSKVSPTPLALEPSPDPNQHIGEMVGHAAAAVAPAMATGGASLPVQAAVGSMVGGAEGGVPGAIVGGAMPVVAKAASEGIAKLGQVAQDKEWAAKLWNQVAKVKAGRQGTQLDIPSGQFKTLPGRSMVDEDAGPLSQVAKAYLARPDAATQAAAYQELSNAGKSLGKSLAKIETPVDITADLPLADTKVQSALEAVGVKPSTIRTVAPNPATLNQPMKFGTRTELVVTPTEAHAIRSDLGSRINWNPSVYNDANEALKEAYFKIGDKIDAVLPDSIKPALKRWQESYLFNKALQNTIEKAASKPPILSPAIKRAAQGAGLTIGGAEAYRLGQHFGVLP